MLAAQHWHALRDELTSGRLGDFVRRAQRPDLLPRLEKARSADDQLDDWLGRLPTTKPSAPELDVHPESLLVRAVGGGGLTRQTLRVTNIGYRLLRSTARVEPVGVRWLRLPAESNGGPFATIDQTDLAVELDLPETLEKPLEASILIESNGGTRRIPVRIERAEVPAELPDAAVPEGFQLPLSQVQLGEKLAEVRPGVRVLFGAGGAILLRLIVLLVGLVLHGAAARPLEARLSSVALALVGAGAWRRACWCSVVAKSATCRPPRSRVDRWGCWRPPSVLRSSRASSTFWARGRRASGQSGSSGARSGLWLRWRRIT